MSDLRQILDQKSTRNGFAELRTTLHALFVRLGSISDEQVRDQSFVMGQQFYSLAINARPKYDDRANELVVDKLSKPTCCTAEEVGTAFREYLLCTTAEFDLAYQEFKSALLRMTAVGQRSQPLPTHSGALSILDSESLRSQIPLWESESGYSVSIVAVLPAEFQEGEGFENHRTIYVSVTARATSDAFRAACAELQSVLTSIFQSAELLAQHRVDVAAVQQMMTGQIPQDLGQVEIPFVVDNHLHNSFNLVPACLNEHFQPSTKKNTIVRRIRNANQLLVEADRQSKNAVGLSLSIAAIEALVCDSSGTEIATQLSEFVATILEPELPNRPAAVDWIKKLYNTRSKLVHGESVDCSENDLKNARLLAAAVLKAMIERRVHQSKVGIEDETPESLIKELKWVKWKTGQLTGVDDSPVTSLWRFGDRL